MSLWSLFNVSVFTLLLVCGFHNMRLLILIDSEREEKRTAEGKDGDHYALACKCKFCC